MARCVCRGEKITRAYQRIIVVVIFVVVIAIVVAIIISAWPSRWCSYEKLFPCGAGDLPKETCSREPLRWEVFQGFDDRRENFPRIGLGDFELELDEFTQPRILTSADIRISNCIQQKK